MSRHRDTLQRSAAPPCDIVRCRNGTWLSQFVAGALNVNHCNWAGGHDESERDVPRQCQPIVLRSAVKVSGQNFRPAALPPAQSPGYGTALYSTHNARYSSPIG